MGCKVVVKLTGGLGNQLFGLAAGMAQAARLNCELILDISNYNNENPRSFELSELGFQTQYFSDTKTRRTTLKLLSSGRQDIFREKSFNFDESIFGVHAGVTLEGYFQSYKYFISVEEEVRQLLVSKFSSLVNSETGREPGQYNSSTTVHVRRGDYLNPETQQFHGLAQPAFFDRAIRLVRNIDPETHLRVYSDSPIENLLREILDDHGNYSLAAQNASNQATLWEMSRSKNFIMSNSSFSWWAAWLMDQSKDGTVIAPRPWFNDGTSGHDLLLPHWITFDAR